MSKIDLVVTRHPALLTLLTERGIATPGTPVVEHVVDASVLDGQHVAGVLPLTLAARCASVTEIPLTLRADQRGRELGLGELRAAAGEPTTYTVRVAS